MVILVFNRGNLGADYWRYIVPGLVVSSGANNITFLALNISIMASVPPSGELCGLPALLNSLTPQLMAVLVQCSKSVCKRAA